MAGQVLGFTFFSVLMKIINNPLGIAPSIKIDQNSYYNDCGVNEMQTFLRFSSIFLIWIGFVSFKYYQLPNG